jgi:hypothetical protein
MSNSSIKLPLSQVLTRLADRSKKITAENTEAIAKYTKLYKTYTDAKDKLKKLQEAFVLLAFATNSSKDIYKRFKNLELAEFTVSGGHVIASLNHHLTELTLIIYIRFVVCKATTDIRLWNSRISLISLPAAWMV